MVPLSPSSFPPSLKTFCQDPPWRVSSSLFSRAHSSSISSDYYKVAVLPSDPEFKLVLKYFHDQQPTNRAIKCIYFIHNSRLAQRFENDISSMEKEAKNPIFQPKWKEKEPKSLRQIVAKRFEKLANPYSPFTIPWDKDPEVCTSIKILPLWHGSKRDKCESICTSGFQFFGKHSFSGHGGSNLNTDEGYFGSGIYFTTSARYAADVYSDRENLLIGWVAMREPFPVVNDKPLSSSGFPQNNCSDMTNLKGKGAIENYNAHYIPVAPAHANNITICYPCPFGFEPTWDEIVVFHPQQTLCRFWIEMGVDLPHMVPKNPAQVGNLLDLMIKIADHPEIKKKFSPLAEALKLKINTTSLYPDTDLLDDEDSNLYELAQNLMSGDMINEDIAFLLMKSLAPKHSAISSVPSPIQIKATSLNTTGTNTEDYDFPSARFIPSQPNPSPKITSLFNPNSSTQIRLLKSFRTETDFYFLAPLSDGTIATGSYDGRIRIYDPYSSSTDFKMKPQRYLEGPKDFYHFNVLPEGKLAVTSVIWDTKLGNIDPDQDIKINIWNIATGVCLQTLKRQNFRRIECFAVSSNGILASGFLDGGIGLWDLSTGEYLRSIKSEINVFSKNSVAALVFLPNGILASAYYDKTIRLWDLSTGECLHILRGERSLIVLPNGILASCGGKTIKFWDSFIGECLGTIKYSADVYALKFLPNGILASITGFDEYGNRKKTLLLWNSLEKYFYGTNDPGCAMAVLHDGTLISYNSEGTIHLWEIK